MTPDELKQTIIPCNTARPFVFISYNSRDKETVWQDVVTLQERGFNIWIDTFLDRTRSTWHEDALRQIHSPSCQLVCFYLSRYSLTSAPCYRELMATRSEEARRNRLGSDVPMVVVEAEPVGDLTGLFNSMYKAIVLDHDSQSFFPFAPDTGVKAVGTMGDFKTNFFPDNDRVRIKALESRERTEDYYRDIADDLLRMNLQPASPLLRFYDAVQFLCEGRILPAYRLLYDGMKEHCVPALLLLAYLQADSDLQKARRFLRSARAVCGGIDWELTAEESYRDFRFSEALAYYLGAALEQNRAELYFKGATMWSKKGSRQRAMDALSKASSLGSREAAAYLASLRQMNEEQFRELREKNWSHPEKLPTK